MNDTGSWEPLVLKNMGAAIIDFRVSPPLVKCQNIMFSGFIDMLMYGFSSTGVTIYCYYTPTHRVGAILQSPCLSVRSHFHNRYLSFYWKKWFYIWYMALAWWLVPCVSPFQVYRTSTSCFGLKFNDNTCCEVICKRRYNDNDIMTTNKLPGMYFY